MKAGLLKLRVRWPDKCEAFMSAIKITLAIANKQPEAFGLSLNFLWLLSLFQDKESDKAAILSIANRLVSKLVLHKRDQKVKIHYWYTTIYILKTCFPKKPKAPV